MALIYFAMQRKCIELGDYIAEKRLDVLAQDLKGVPLSDERILSVASPQIFFMSLLSAEICIDPLQLRQILQFDSLERISVFTSIVRLSSTYEPEVRNEFNIFFRNVARVLMTYDSRVRPYIAITMVDLWIFLSETTHGELARAHHETILDLRNATDIVTSIFTGLRKIILYREGEFALNPRAGSYIAEYLKGEEIIPLLKKIYQHSNNIACLCVLQVHEAMLAEEFIKKIKSDSKYNFEKLTPGAKRCLEFYAYYLFIIYQCDITALEPVFLNALEKVSAEEQSMIAHKTPIGLEVNLRPNYGNTASRSFAWCSLLSMFDVYSRNYSPGHKAQAVEMAPLPTYSFTAFELAANALTEIFDAPAQLNPVPIHLNVGGFSESVDLEGIQAIAFVCF